MDNNLFFQKKSKSQSLSKVVKQQPIKKLKSSLNDLIEVNEDENNEEEEIQNISFSLSNCDDMNELLDNFSVKSEEKHDIEYVSTTNEEGIELISDFLRENTKQILNNRKGFDEEIKKMSNDFYTDLISNVNIKDIKKRPVYLDKTKNTNYNTKSESITSDEQTKFRNDLIGHTFENNKNDTGYGKIMSLKSKNSSSNFIEEDDEEDKIIEIRKKKNK